MAHIDKNLFFWFLAGLAIFLPFAGNVSLFDGLELHTAEMAREMLLTGNYLTLQYNFEDHFVTAPLFIWLQALSFGIFGVNEFAARFPNALFGAFLLPLLYAFGKRIFDEKFGNLWAMAWLGSILPLVFLKSGMGDPTANLLAFVSLYFLITGSWKHSKIQRIQFNRPAYWYMAVSGFFAGLAFLANGPVTLVVIYTVLMVKWLTKRKIALTSFPLVLVHLAAASVPFLIWFAVLFNNGKQAFFAAFMREQLVLFQSFETGIEGVPGFHFIVLILGCFPASIFALQSVFNKSGGPTYQREFKRWMLILMWVVILLFTLLKMKLIHYSSLAYFPITYLAALSLYRIQRGEWLFKVWMTRVGIGMAVVVSFFPLAAAFIAKNPKLILPYMSARPGLKEGIETVYYWFHLEYILGPLFILLVLVFIWKLPTIKHKAFYGLFLGNALLTVLGLAVFVGKFEKLTQQDLVQYLKQQKEPVYVQFVDYPASTIPLFYGQLTPEMAQAIKAYAAGTLPELGFKELGALRSAHANPNMPDGWIWQEQVGNFHLLSKAKQQ